MSRAIDIVLGDRLERVLGRLSIDAPLAVLAFVATLGLGALAVRNGILADDAVRLWAGASSAADGQVPIGKIIAGYPTLPFLATTLIAWTTSADTPAPALLAAVLFAVVTASCFRAMRKSGLAYPLALVFTLLIILHPALLRAVVSGPADMFLAVFLWLLCLALYDLRAHSGTSEVMGVGLALMGLAFSHPLGAAIAFAASPFLAFAVRPMLVANSAFNVLIALLFPTSFMLMAFTYVSWVFPGAGWSFFAAPAESLSLWTVAVSGRLSGVLAFDASFAMLGAIVTGAPIAVAMVARAYRRRPLVIPAAVFVASAIAATALSIASGLFGDPTAIVVVAPVLAAAVTVRVPIAREQQALTTVLLVLGWFGGFLSIALVDPGTVNRFRTAVVQGSSQRLDTIAAGGAFIGRDGVLADIDNAPALVLGNGRARGILGPDSEPFALALLFDRVEAPYVALPDPSSAIGAHDRLDRAFPSLFRDGLPGYRIIYQNNTWRVLSREQRGVIHKQ